MSQHVFLVSLAVGSAAIALWFYARFPKLAPRGFRLVALHLIAAFAVARAGALVAERLRLDAPLEHIPVAVPVLGYLFLAGLWALALLQGMLRSSVR